VSVETSTSQAAREGSWPALPGERNWGALGLFGVCVSAAVATWVFIIGGYVSYYLPADYGTVAMIAGSLVGIGIVVLAVLPVAGRYGIDSVAAVRPQLGTRGQYLGLAVLFLSVLGWNALLIVFLGRAAADILIELDVVGSGARDAVIIIAGLASLLVVWGLLRGGPDVMRNVGAVVATAVALLSVWVLYLLISEVGWSTITSAEPAFATESHTTNMMLGAETVMVTNLSWWAYIGGMIRLVPTARRALWPAILGLGLPVSLLSLIGLFGGLAVPDSGGDPTAFLIDVGGAGAAIPALAFILVANVGTTLVGAYVTALGLKQIPAVQERLSWSVTTAVTLLPVAIVVAFFSGWFFDNVGTFLAFLGVAFAPLCGIQIADFYALRRRRVALRAIFDLSPGSPFSYWGGVNPAGVLAIAVGAAVYILLLDPVEYVSRAPFQYLSATVPAAFSAGLVFWLVTKLVVIPAGKGGYVEEALPAPPVAEEHDQPAAVISSR
jgi:NCS1 family nucleobase:cation symporter-1